MILDIVEKMVMLPIIITAVYMVIIFIVELNINTHYQPL